MENIRNSPSAQTADIFYPFSVMHKLLRPERWQFKNQIKVKTVTRYGYANGLGLTLTLILTYHRSGRSRLCAAENG